MMYLLQSDTGWRNKNYTKISNFTYWTKIADLGIIFSLSGDDTSPSDTRYCIQNITGNMPFRFYWDNMGHPGSD